MKKFEPGDLVIGNAAADDEYGITETNTIWKVLKYESEDFVLIGTYFRFDPTDYQEFDVEDQYFDKLPFRLGDVITFSSDVKHRFKVINLEPYDGSGQHNSIKLCDLYTNEERFYTTDEVDFRTAKVIVPADLQQSFFNIENDDRDLL